MDKLLFTGASGFLGRNTVNLLKNIYDVTTLGRNSQNMISVDLAKDVPQLQDQFDVVLHAAGKAHVQAKSAEDKQAFFDVNYKGTMRLCEALAKVGTPKSFVFVSSTSVYGGEDGMGGARKPICELHSLNGKSAYAQSKIRTEEYLTEWCKRHNVILSILRPSLLIGKDAPGNLGSMIKGIKKGYYVNVGGDEVRKSALIAEDIARLLPLVAEKGGVYNVCDTYHPTIKEMSFLIARQLGRRNPLTIPYWMALCMAKIGDFIGDDAPINSYKLSRMTQSITFSNEKARTILGWEPLDFFENFKIN